VQLHTPLGKYEFRRMKDEPQKLSVDPPSWDFHLRYLLR
jgi:hypothetical protein